MKEADLLDVEDCRGWTWSGRRNVAHFPCKGCWPSRGGWVVEGESISILRLQLGASSRLVGVEF